MIYKNFFTQPDAGFTIIELVVATGVLVAIGGMIAGILASSLRGTNKTRITTAVTQNGNYALSVISDTIRDSDAVVTAPNDTATNACSGVLPTPTAAINQIYLHRLNGAYTALTLDCAGSNGGGISLSSTTGVTPNPSPQSLIDTSQVKISSTLPCFFTCTQADLYTPPTINVQFSLSGANTTSSAESQASTSFITQISLYNSIAR